MDKETAFNFNIPLQVLEKGEDGDWYVEGIAATENKDFQGEILKIDGLDIATLSKNGFFNEDHKKGFQHILGKIEHAEKRENEEVGKHLYVKGRLFKTQPGAQACYNIMKELSNSDKQMQLSVEGKILKREGKDKKIITKAKVENVALTLNPVNDHTFATFLKSFGDGGFSEVKEDVGDISNNEISTSSQPNDMVDVKLNKSTYDKLISFIDDKKTFKEHIYDLVKGMSPEERDGVFKVLIKAKQELEKKKVEKALGATDSYATQLPQERIGGDVMTKESLDEKKKKIKKVVTEIKKAYPEIDTRVIFNKVLEKLS